MGGGGERMKEGKGVVTIVYISPCKVVHACEESD